MKNLLAIITAFAILMPVSSAFSASHSNPAAPHTAVPSVQENKVSADNPGVTLVKQKHGKKRTKGKKRRSSHMRQTQVAPKH